MLTNDFVYKATYKACIDLNLPVGVAANTAALTLDRYKKNKFQGSVAKFIANAAEEAKRQYKK